MKRLLPFLVALGLFIPYFAPTVASAAICSAIFATPSNLNADNVGGLTNRQERGQSFTVASQCDISNIIIQANKDSGTADNLQAAIFSNGTSTPVGSLLSTIGTFSPTAPTQPATASTTAPVAFCLQPSTTYWLVVSRSGALSDVSGWYWVAKDFSGGTTAVMNNGIWAASANHYIYEIDDGGSACGGGATAPKINWNLILFGDW